MLNSSLPRSQSSWGQHGAHLGPVGPKWTPCWPHEPCYQGYERDIWCYLWVPGLIYILLLSWQSSMQYDIILDCFVMRLGHVPAEYIILINCYEYNTVPNSDQQGNLAKLTIMCVVCLIIPPTQRSCWGGILVSLRPSVRPSIRPSVPHPGSAL